MTRFDFPLWAATLYVRARTVYFDAYSTYRAWRTRRLLAALNREDQQ